ncbi:RFC related checkpoint protein Rad17 [Schizosaccharomyces osmophilus]|uniref:RFC related checkpoint protein Rad17 n=1 Tax=Schizosaccharomyces osmophilus TaxID=2545709 RepID=A0AAF0AWR2_9SCHI|nr:RFC related checkpoint protein Rad17 [Schizosaccharomyces osmophilus]WBW73623.1 RFC related checkpoint protein Rad17 [Schizosaccharomyces osmophilus]
MQRRSSLRGNTKNPLSKSKRKGKQYSIEFSSQNAKRRRDTRTLPDEEIEAISDEESTPISSDSSFLWFEKYQPTESSELAVHKGKVNAIRQWMSESISHSRLLVLSGPPGCGKSITVRLLAHEMGASLVEWSNPMDTRFKNNQEHDHDQFSLTEKFQRFMSLAETYPELELCSTTKAPKKKDPSKVKKFILLDELPYLSKQTGTLQMFQEVLLSALQSRGSYSIILVLTETKQINSEGNNFQEKELNYGTQILGPELLEHHHVSIIPMNPIATTFMRKAIDNILKKEKIPIQSKSSPFIQELITASEGDLRNALNALQFYLPKKNRQSHSNGNNKKSKNQLEVSIEASEMLDRIASSKDSLYSAMPTIQYKQEDNDDKRKEFQKDIGLGMLHALGKVVWNKREGDDEILSSKSETPPNLPYVKEEHKKLGHECELFGLVSETNAVEKRPSLVDIKTTIEQAGLSGSMFRYGIFENYTDSCLNQMEAHSVSDILSFADTMAIDYPYSYRADEMSLWFAIQGTLWYLPSPVPRKWRQLKFRRWREEDIPNKPLDDYLAIYGKSSTIDHVQTLINNENQALEDPDDPIEDDDPT